MYPCITSCCGLYLPVRTEQCHITESDDVVANVICECGWSEQSYQDSRKSAGNCKLARLVAFAMVFLLIIVAHNADISTLM